MSTIIQEMVNLVDAFGVKDIIQLGASLTQQGIDAGTKAYIRKAEEKKTLIEVPEIYASDYRLKLDDAKRWLEEDGLKAEAVVARPNIALKDCSDLEVVATNYKLKQKVKPGTRIILKYVTSEVIKESQKLSDESERNKAEAEQKKIEEQAEKANKKAEQDAKIKQSLNKTAANIQQGFSKVVANTQKGITEILSNVTKNERSNDSEENE